LELLRGFSWERPPHSLEIFRGKGGEVWMSASVDTFITIFNSWITFMVLLALVFAVVHYGSKLNYPAKKPKR